MVIMISK